MMKKEWKTPNLQLLDIRETMGGDKYFGFDNIFDFDFTKPPKDSPSPPAPDGS